MMKKSPRYLTIYHALKHDIITNKYPAGSFLPTEGDLEEIYSASRTTIRAAIGLLRDENLISVKQGKGTVVLPTVKSNTSFKISTNNTLANVSNLFLVEGEDNILAQGATIDIVEADSKTASALGIPLGSATYRLQRVKIIGSDVFCYAVSYVPCTLAPGLEKYNGEIVALYKFLRETYGLTYTTSREALSATSAGFLESKLLNVPEGTPLLTCERLAYAGDMPFEFNRSVFRSEIMQITVDFSVIPPEHL